MENNEQIATQTENIQTEQLKTGMIMDVASESNATEEQRQSMQDAIMNNRNMEALARMMPRRTQQLIREHRRVLRNEPCPCGSGLKYKNCCLRQRWIYLPRCCKRTC